MSAIVRAASQADLYTLVALNERVQSLHAELHPERFKRQTDPSAVRSFFAKRLAAPKDSILIAELQRVAVAYVWFERQSVLETPFTLPLLRMYVHHILVVPEARGRGVGTALMRHVEQRATTEGIKELAMSTWAANIGAQGFFSTLGYTPSNIALRKRL
jgi:ribosomal protein S18 acetylase RimI-like enzyme